MEVFQQRRAARAGLQRVTGVRQAQALGRGQKSPDGARGSGSGLWPFVTPVGLAGLGAF
jgi:hypothetical protein